MFEGEVMSFGLSAATIGLISAGTALTSSYLTSKSTKKQAELQANSIREGGQIDQAARNRAISQVLGIFGPSLAQFNESMQDSIDLFNQGRVSTGELLTQSANNVSQISQQGGQNALNAMLGLPSPETVSTAPIGQAPQQQPIAQATPQGIGQGGQDQLNIQPDGTVRPGVQQGFNYPRPAPTQQGISAPQQLNTQPVAQSPPQGINPIADQIPGQQQAGQFPQGALNENLPLKFQQDPNLMAPNRFTNPINQGTPTDVFQPQTPLEGEFIPRDYSFQQQPLGMPQGTQAGLLGAEQAIRESTGIARGDITGGRDFALNQIQQGIQAGRAGTQAGVGSIGQGVDRAVGFLNPYISAGAEALNPYMGLSGARGQEAFDAALINDPAYNLALQESERALGRQAAVTGGIGSGNVKGRFQLNAQQQAAANIDRQLGRYLPIISGGQGAAGQAGAFTTQGGISAGQMQQRGGEFEAGQFGRMGDVGTMSAQQLSQLAQQQGMTESQLRETAGINAANILQGVTGQQIGAEQGLSQNLANLDQQTLNNIINSMQSGAGTTLQSQQQLAQIMANMGVGAGTSGQQTAINLGQAQAAGVTNPIGNALNTGIGLYASGAFNQPQTAYAPPSNLNLNLSQIPAMTGPYS